MEIVKAKKHILLPVLTLLLLISGIFIWLNKDNLSSAADARKFDPSNIISDFVMTNKNSMSEAQIQSFLLSKNSCNDTNTAKAASYPHLSYNIKNGKFVCLAEESFSGKSAAHIIWQAGQDYNINPQVLIVLLEKEQGLITDTWPNNIQYRSATGYGCPDTDDCDTKYYGFKNQVRNAANFFRAYQTGNTGWYKLVWPARADSNFNATDHYTAAWKPFNYDLQLHPNAGCGTTSTYIANRATASLYSYTPYRPNQAALNAQYGNGNNCSSYGNRNFWLFFNDWFGSTQISDTTLPHPDGTLVDINSKVYLIQGGSLHYIVNGTVFESHSYKWSDVKIGTTGDRNLPISWSLDFISQGILYTGDSSGVYMTVQYNGVWSKQLISYASFTKLGYKWSQVRNIPKSHLPKTTVPSTYISTELHPDGTLISKDGNVYIIDHGTLRYVTAAVFSSNGWNWSDIVPSSPRDSQLPAGADMLLGQGSLVSNNGNLYIVQHPAKGSEILRPIGPYECMIETLRYNPSKAIPISSKSLPTARGSIVTC